MDWVIVHNEAKSRFETTVDGALCVLDYQFAGGVLAIDHVGVPQAVGGRGVAGALVKAALGIARAEDWRVAPNCAYAAAWIARHPDYDDLLNRV